MIKELMPGVEESKRSDKMEEGDDLRTMECLRGRLVAERQTSRTAKEEVELMGNKIMELENKLSEETQLKNKAEKKLQLLKKRLESLNLSSVLMKSEQASSSRSEISCLSSTASSAMKYEEENEAKFKISSCFLAQKSTESSLSDTIADHKKALIEEEESGKTQVYGSSTSSAEDYFTDQSSSSSNSSMAEKEKKNEKADDNEISLALIPISLPQKTDQREVKPVNDRVSEVLDSLKHLREMIQISLDRRSKLIEA